MIAGGAPDFPDSMPRPLFGPFWSLRIVDRATGAAIPINGGAFLTGYGSVRRAAKYSTRLYLLCEERRHRKDRAWPG